MNRNVAPLGLIEIAIAPASRADQETLGVALGRMTADDLCLAVRTDPETGRTIVSGSSEQQLDAAVAGLRREHGVDAQIGAPQVAYREAITHRVEIDQSYKRQTSGPGHFARIKLVFEPGEPGSGLVFASAIKHGAVPDEFIPGVEKGLAAFADSGPLAGFPLDFRATLIDGAYHDVDSSRLSFEIAARGALREMKKQGALRLLEPVMRVEVTTPEEHLDSVVADLTNRRGQIQGSERRGAESVVTALAPLAGMFGYVSGLRGISQGRAWFDMTFERYEPLPRAPDDEPGPFAPAAALRA